MGSGALPCLMSAPCAPGLRRGGLLFPDSAVGLAEQGGMRAILCIFVEISWGFLASWKALEATPPLEACRTTGVSGEIKILTLLQSE